MQGKHKGIIVQAFADVALHMALVLPGKPSQTLEQGWRTGGNEAGCDHGLDQCALNAPALHRALP